MAEFVFGAKLDLFLTLLCEQAISHLKAKNMHEVLGNGLLFFVAEAPSTLEVPRLVLLVERQTETLNSEYAIGLGDVPRRKGFG